MGTGRKGLVSLALVVALAATGLAACTDGDGGSAGTTTTTVTTPPHPALVAALSTPGVHELPAPPLRSDPVAVAHHGSDVIVFGSTSPAPGGLHNHRVHDEGAVLDAETLSWRTLPPTPFERPTFRPLITVVGDLLVLAGRTCTPTDGPPGTGMPECLDGPWRSATLDLTAPEEGWTAVRTPDLGDEAPASLATVGDLAVLQPSPGENRHWYALDLQKRSWRLLPDPPVQPSWACSSGTGLTAVEGQRLDVDAGVWHPISFVGVASGEVLGRLLTSTLTAAGVWSDASEPQLLGGTDGLWLACAPGVFVAVVLPVREDQELGTEEPGMHVQDLFTGAWSERPVQPPLEDGDSVFRQPDLPGPVGPTQILVGEFSRRHVYDLATDTWTPVPVQVPDAAEPLGTSIGPATIWSSRGLHAWTP